MRDRRLAQQTGRGRGAPGVPKGEDAVAGRIEDLADILAQGYTLRGAAARLGVHVRTAHRYRIRLRAQQGAA